MLTPDYHHRARWTKRVLVALALILALWASHLEYEAGASPAPAECQEDQPCWDCETMGNRICGPIPVPAEPTFTG